MGKLKQTRTSPGSRNELDRQSRKRPDAGPDRLLSPRTALYARPRPQVAGQKTARGGGSSDGDIAGLEIPTRLGAWTFGSHFMTEIACVVDAYDALGECCLWCSVT